jgi:hypothetical protein
VIIVAAVIAGMSVHSFAAFGALTGAVLLYVISVGIVVSTLRAIFGAVLYMFARTGEAPAGFDAAALRNAVRAA